MVEQAGFSSSKSRGGGRPQDKSEGPLSRREVSLLNAVLTAGLYDSVGRILYTPSVDLEDRAKCQAETPQGKATVHPSSVNRNLQTHGWLLYQEKVSR